MFLTNMYKLFLEKRFSNLKECKYFYKWNIVSYQKKFFRRQFRWIPVEMLCPILDKNLPVENEISLISFKIFDINIWSQCKKKTFFYYLTRYPRTNFGLLTMGVEHLDSMFPYLIAIWPVGHRTFANLANYVIYF